MWRGLGGGHGAAGTLPSSRLLMKRLLMKRRCGDSRHLREKAIIVPNVHADQLYRSPKYHACRRSAHVHTHATRAGRAHTYIHTLSYFIEIYCCAARSTETPPGSHSLVPAVHSPQHAPPGEIPSHTLEPAEVWRHRQQRAHDLALACTQLGGRCLGSQY